jgi:4'-phosphopantetheinyl transferase
MQKDDAISTWSAPPVLLDLHPHEVHIWRLSLELSPDSVGSLESHLSADESQRAARFRFPADRHRFISSHGCLRDVLARYLHCEPGEIEFSTNKHGKPVLKHHELEFNLSHSGDFALVAVSQSHRVGVDVERIRAGISSLVIARQYFSKNEFAELEALPLESRETAFFTCWTRKEAYIKAHGLGLSLPLDSFDVSLSPDEPAVLRATRPDSSIASGWTLKSLDFNAGYAAAVAVEGHDLEFALWDWQAD